MEDYISHFVCFQKEKSEYIGSGKKESFRDREFTEKFYRKEVVYEEGIGLCIGREGLFHKIYTFYDCTGGDHLILAREEEIIEVGRKMSIEECLTSERENDS
jgi:hypothetical protein